MAKNAVYIVDYTPKSIAVFGDTMPIKESLKKLGGSYNASLNDGSGGTQPGWIFSAKKRLAVEEMVLPGTTAAAFATAVATVLATNSSDSIKTSVGLPSTDSSLVTSVATTPASWQNLRIVDYSAKSIAVFGDTKSIKDTLKKIGGRYNTNLKDGLGGTQPGWVFTASNRKAVEEVVLPAADFAAALDVAASSSASNSGVQSSNNNNSVATPFNLALGSPSVTSVIPTAAAVSPFTGLGLRVVDYTPKSIAVFGDTKPIKESLKKLGGRYNGRLNDGSGGTQPGWVFSSSNRAAMEKLVLSASGGDVNMLLSSKPTTDSSNGISTTTATNPLVLAATDVSVDTGSILAATYQKDQTLRVVDYSAKSIAVFGDTTSIKDALKKLGGIYNAGLKDGSGGRQESGWIFRVKDRQAVEDVVLPAAACASATTAAAANNNNTTVDENLDAVVDVVSGIHVGTTAATTTPGTEESIISSGVTNDALPADAPIGSKRKLELDNTYLMTIIKK